MSSPFITLTTDFGLTDHYVGVMKGVIATITPEARVVDLCHELPAYGVGQAAFTIAQSYRYFPAGTVHVVVVDPGVGTARKALLAEAGGHRFVAPDNGVLSQVFEMEEYRAWSVDAARFALKPTSRTFQARDLFAPVAAHAAAGRASGDFGKLLEQPVRMSPTKPRRIAAGRWQGRVLAIDRFGNIVTSFAGDLIREADEDFRLRVGKIEAAAWAATYEEAPKGEVFAIAGSSGYVELSLREDSAAAKAQVRVGDPAEFSIMAD